MDERYGWRLWMKGMDEGYGMDEGCGWREWMKGMDEEYGWSVWMKGMNEGLRVLMMGVDEGYGVYEGYGRGEGYGWRMGIKCMNEGWRFDLQLAGLLSSICYILQWIVCVLASWFTDWIRQKQFISTIR